MRIVQSLSTFLLQLNRENTTNDNRIILFIITEVKCNFIDTLFPDSFTPNVSNPAKKTEMGVEFGIYTFFAEKTSSENVKTTFVFENETLQNLLKKDNSTEIRKIQNYYYATEITIAVFPTIEIAYHLMKQRPVFSNSMFDNDIEKMSPEFYEKIKS